MGKSILSRCIRIKPVNYFETFVIESGSRHSLGINSKVNSIKQQGRLLFGNQNSVAGFWQRSDDGFSFNPLPNTLSNETDESWVYDGNEDASIIYGGYGYGIGCQWVKTAGGDYNQIELENQHLIICSIKGSKSVGREIVSSDCICPMCPPSIVQRTFYADIRGDGKLSPEYLAGTTDSRAIGLSGNGKYVIGIVQTAAAHPSFCYRLLACKGNEACLWQLESGTSTFLRDPAISSCCEKGKLVGVNSPSNCKYCGNLSVPCDVNDDATVVGSLTPCPCKYCVSSASAFISVKDRGMHSIEKLMAENSVLPGGHKLLAANSITKGDDGVLIVVGTSIFENKPHTWKLTLKDIARLSFPSTSYSSSILGGADLESKHDGKIKTS